MLDIYKNICVIIPAVYFNNLTNECIQKIFSISEDLEIIILLDHQNKKKLIFNKNLKIAIYPMSISAKRNYGAKLTERKYLAFIDSDAYPETNWLEEGIKCLLEYPTIYIVGGPNISPIKQNFQSQVVGLAQKSFFISGKWNYHKKIGKSKFVDNLYSCNMITKKEIFLRFNGMNEDMLTGEDTEFCKRINDNNKRIFFSNKVIVYHYDRDFKKFFLQKIIRGLSVTNVLSINQFSIKHLIFLLMLFAPFLFFIFQIIGFISFLINFAYLFLFYQLIMVVYFICCLFESLRYSKIYLLPFTFLLIFFGNLSIGLGTFLKLLKIPINIKKIYKNY